MPQHKAPLIFPEGIIPVYAQIIGPRHKTTIKLALDTGASITMIPPEKIIVTGHKIPALTCLGITVRNIDVVCHNLPSESPVEGLLGLNFLTHLPAFAEFYQKIHLHI